MICDPDKCLHNQNNTVELQGENRKLAVGYNFLSKIAMATQSLVILALHGGINS